MKLRHVLIGIPVIAVVAAGGWWYYQYSSVHPSTSDAYLGGPVVHIAPQVSGPIQSVLVAAKAARGALGDDDAAIKAAKAALGQAQLELKHTRIVAPADGIVGDFDLRPGSYLTAGNPLFALVESRDPWIDANWTSVRAG